MGVLTLPNLDFKPTFAPGDWHVDSSWQLGLVIAAHAHLHFGTDILWTHGPLGRLDFLTLYYRPEWIQAIASAVVVNLALVVVLAALLIVRRAPIWAWMVITAVLMAPRAILPGVAFGLSLLGILLLMLVFAVERPKLELALGGAAGVALGASALVKQFDVVVAILTLGIAMGLVWKRPSKRQAITVSLGTAAVSATLLWFATGQNLGDVLPYVRGSLAISVDYRAALQSGTELLGPALAAISIIILGMNSILIRSGRSRYLARTFVMFLPLLAVGFEEAFARDDPGPRVDIPQHPYRGDRCNVG